MIPAVLMKENSLIWCSIITKEVAVAQRVSDGCSDIQSHVAFQMVFGHGVNCFPYSPGSGTASTELSIPKPHSRTEALNQQL